MSVSRRDALRSLLAAGASAVVARPALAGGRKAKRDAPLIIDDPRAHYPNTSRTEEMYRQELAQTYGDKKEWGYAFHCVNCQGNCAWEVWTKDGKVTRETQSASYPAISATIPDANPRGCNKGAQHSQTMYAEDRLLYPLERVGARGEGRWRRIGWDEAITKVARHLYDTLVRVGPAGNYIHNGSGVLSEARGAAFKRLGTLLGAVRPYIASYVGDMFPGTSVVYGEGNIGCSYDFMYGTQVQIYWGCNPNVSRIPDAHYVWEGKYNGSKVIVISPEMSSTALRADRWVPVKAGYDGHLALAIMHTIVRRRLYNETLLKTYTDLPLLVRADNKKLLRLSDIDMRSPWFDAALHARMFGAAKGDVQPEAVFLASNQATGKLTALPGSEGSSLHTLRLSDVDFRIDPALRGTFEVPLASGERVRATTVFELLVAELERFSPEATERLTGVHPVVVEELARDIALPKVASLTIGFSIGKHWNGLQSQRAISSLVALTGRLGDRGGTNTENEWAITGLDDLTGFGGKYRHRFASGFVSELLLGGGLDDYDKAFGEADVKRATGRSKSVYKDKLTAMLFAHKNDDSVGKSKPYWDTVETFLLVADGRLTRNKGTYRDAFLGKAKFLACADVRMSETARFADIVLPCKSHYEVWDLRVNPGYHRYANVSQPPPKLEPIGETKSEWEIALAIATKLEELAVAEYKQSGDKRRLHIPDATHSQTGFRELDELVGHFTAGGQLGTDKQAVEFALSHVEQFKGETLQSTRRRGGHLMVNEKAGKSSPLYPDRPYSTFEKQLYLLEPFETLSGRLTFYVDHPLWIELGAALPVATEPLRPGRQPLLLMTPHARWSIHSTYKTSTLLLRLQRGKPWVMLNPGTADKRGIRDGDTVVMSNELARVEVIAKVTPMVPADVVVMEHGWEPFMFAGRESQNALVPAVVNALEVSEGWGHLRFGVNWDGNQHAYTGMVDVRRA